jgi:hypothetical protein
MIAVSNSTTSKQTVKAASHRERVMASTVSVDEYFDELVSCVHQDYANV